MRFIGIELRSLSTALLAAGLAFLSACGGGFSSSGSVGAPPPPATLRLLPGTGDIKVGGALQMWVEDAQGHAVQASFSVVEAQGGTADATGRYQAPATAGTYHLRATSSQAPGAVGGAGGRD